MSTSPQLDGGGGGGGSTGGTSGGSDGGSDGSSSDGGTTYTILLPDWVIALAPLAGIVDAIVSFFTDPRFRTAFVVSSLTGLGIETVYRLLDAGKSPVAIIIDDYIFRTVLLPLGISIFTGTLDAIEEFISLTFGSDGRVGVTPGSQPGLVDIPLELAVQFATGFAVFGLTVFNVVRVFNQGLAGDLAGIGLAAPIWINFLWVVEMTAIGLLVWVLISFIPVVNVRGILLSSMSIPRRVLNRLL